MPHRVLVVDDESLQRRLFRRQLEAHGLKAVAASSAAEALAMTRRGDEAPHLILCDISMPEIDGVVFVKALRAAPETAHIPVILMTGLSLPTGLMEAAAEALDVGPVHLKGGPFPALLARIRARLQEPPAKDIVVDPIQRTISIDGRRLPELPARRFQLLCALLRRPRAVSREELLERVWNGKENLNIVDVTVMRLRQDLKFLPFLRIETIPAGYRLVLARPDSL